MKKSVFNLYIFSWITCIILANSIFSGVMRYLAYYMLGRGGDIFLYKILAMYESAIYITIWLVVLALLTFVILLLEKTNKAIKVVHGFVVFASSVIVPGTLIRFTRECISRGVALEDPALWDWEPYYDNETFILEFVKIHIVVAIILMILLVIIPLGASAYKEVKKNY